MACAKAPAAWRYSPRYATLNNQALSGSIDCSDFSCGRPMQAGRPFSRNSLWVIPQRTQALESKSKRCPRAVRSSGILTPRAQAAPVARQERHNRQRNAKTMPRWFRRSSCALGYAIPQRGRAAFWLGQYDRQLRATLARAVSWNRPYQSEILVRAICPSHDSPEGYPQRAMGLLQQLRRLRNI